MLLVHDIVEIDAGDTFAYDEEGKKTKAEREKRAAERLFHLLPSDQAKEFHDLWLEFEERETAEAQFAVAIDRFHPSISNHHNDGIIWRKYNIRKDKAVDRHKVIGDSSPLLWEYLEKLIDDAVEKGWLRL